MSVDLTACVVHGPAQKAKAACFDLNLHVTLHLNKIVLH